MSPYYEKEQMNCGKFRIQMRKLKQIKKILIK